MNASFIHRCGPEMASYRYRAQIPSRELGLTMNDLSADTLVFTKPLPDEVEMARDAIEDSPPRTVIVDFCDDHFDKEPQYQQFLNFADYVTCPTEEMARRLRERWTHFLRDERIHVIPDPYEYAEDEPHCSGTRLLWFGHGSNFPSLQRVIRSLDDYELMIVSNLPFARPWSKDEMEAQFCQADIVVIPATAPHKSPNRAVEAIRQGCFVVAEPHPSLEGFPGIWIGDLKEGIEWASQHLQEANQRTWEAQQWVSERFSPRTLAFAWKTLLEQTRSHSISVAARCAGPVGSTSIPLATV